MLHDRTVYRLLTCDMALSGHTKRAFLDSFMALKQGIPSHDAFCDLFSALAPLRLQTVLMRLVEGFADQPGPACSRQGCDCGRQQDAVALL